MSRTKKKFEPQVAVESHELCSPEFPPADPSSIPFEEWSDSDVNIEKWEINKDTKEETVLFRDPQVVHLPPSLHGVEWKRPCETFPDANLTLFIDNPGIPDLIGGSKHLLHSEFVRDFVYSVATLCHVGDAGRFNVEYACLQFCPTSGGRPWRPWHHVYSNCHAGKGQLHKPRANKSGKYIVRLFWLGSWKKIYVDDLLPVNADNEVLLPSLPSKDQLKQSPSEKPSKSKSLMGNKKVIELWPFLLAKALMKLASLTWDSSHDLVDFDIIQCLSGWIPYKINTRGMNEDEIWDICMKYTSHYEWHVPKEGSTSKLNKSQRSKDHSKPKIGNLRSKNNTDQYCLAMCFQHSQCTVADCGTHCSMIEQTRNIPLVKPSREEDFPQWKRFRWLDWAIENDIIPPKTSSIPIRCLQLVDPFRYSCNSIYGEENASEGDNVIHSTFVKAGSTRELSRKGDESKRLGLGLKLNLSRWLDLGQVCEHIICFVVYFKPSKFPVKIRISDLSSKTITKEVRYPILKTLEDSMALEWKEIIRPQSSMYHNSEAVYMLSDSSFSRTVIINFAQVASPQVLEDNTDKRTGEEKVQTSDSECGICLSTILERLKKKHVEKPDEKDERIIRVIPNEFHDRLQGHLVLCKFKWYSEHIDDVVDTLKTYATSTMVLNLVPGRHLFRLFIKTGTAYVTQILSDAPLCVGYLEEIYPLMTEETSLVIKESEALAKSFQDLVKSFGKEDYLDKLRHFYDSYKPQCELDKRELLTVHETFRKELLQLVADNLDEAEWKALRILLKQWQFPYREYDPEDTRGFCCEPDGEDMEYVKILQKATVVIQAFLRGVYERQMMKRHLLSNKHHKTTVECLQRIHSLLSTKGTILLRHYLLHPDVSYLTEKWGGFEDIHNVITLYQFSNNTRVSSEDWNFICRQTFYVSTLLPTPIRINMFCDVDRFSVRVFNNDQGREMKIHTDNVLVNLYHSNATGYTVLCYGNSSTSKQLYYKLCYVVPKETGEKLLHFPHDPTKKEIITGNYIPNKNNRICRYMIRAQSEEVLMTLHFSTNNSNVKINLRLFKDEELLKEIEGRGSVLLPIILLGSNRSSDSYKKISKDDSMKFEDKKCNVKALRKSRNRSQSSSTGGKDKMNDVNEVYFMEAIAVDDSWPLTAAEWRVVERLRADKLWGGPNRIVDEGSTTKKNSANPEIQSPYWTIQIITDYVDVVKLSRDEKRDIELRHMKIRWNENDPTRYEKSKELRNTFITENKIKNEEICLEREMRSCNPEIFEEEILPPFETYCNKYRRISSAAERQLKDLAKLEKDAEDEFEQLVKFREYNENENQKIEETGTLQIDNYNLMKNWYNECRMESEKMMEDAYKAKLMYIENVSKCTSIIKGKEKKEKKSPTKSKKK